MFLNVSKINNFIRVDDILELFTLESPIYHYYVQYCDSEYSISVLYRSLKDMLFFLNLDTSCIVSPISVRFVEILVPVRRLIRKVEQDTTVCLISNTKYNICEIELICKNRILYYVTKEVASKYFYVVEFQSIFRIRRSRDFFDIFSFQDYLEYLISEGKIYSNKSLHI